MTGSRTKAVSPKPKPPKLAVERGFTVKRADGTLYREWWVDEGMADLVADSDYGERVVKIEIREVSAE